MSSDFAEDGRVPDPIFNDQVPEDSWDSISQRMATSKNTTAFEKTPGNLQLQRIISAAESVETKVSDPTSKAQPGLIEGNEKEIKTEYETPKTMPTFTRTAETPIKRADPSDKRMNRARLAVTPSQFLIYNGFDIDLNPSGLPKALEWAASA